MYTARRSKQPWTRIWNIRRVCSWLNGLNRRQRPYRCDILALSRESCVNSVQTTMFCGGGSLIPYVYKQLTQFCTSNGIRSMQAEDPESAVCRGAVISQMQQKLYGRRCSRASFGIEVTQGGRQYIKWFLVRVR